jgi:hypothetical protein
MGQQDAIELQGAIAKTKDVIGLQDAIGYMVQGAIYRAIGLQVESSYKVLPSDKVISGYKLNQATRCYWATR